ncbi:EF-hand domain-containing protein [Sphingopyxis sp.]|uniref:EF-hand domain-containing protein n=1 Tax=Sphingopyxis sp. TaxID=1908224 RepID=UPI0035AEDA01
MKKKLIFLTLGAALIAVPVLAAPGSADRNATQTRAEAQAHAAERFAKMDANKDGKLDASDRAARHAEMQAKMFDRLDANKDGSISKAEWDQHSADRAAKRGEKRADAGDGKRGMRGHHGGRGGHGGMMMGRADTDGDKAISLAEFQTAALARFDAADANKDGQVTAAERTAQREAWKAKAGEWRAKRGAQPAAPTGE